MVGIYKRLLTSHPATTGANIKGFAYTSAYNMLGDTALGVFDMGRGLFYKGFSDYKKFAKLWIDDMYVGTGWEVLQYILGKHAVNPDFDYTLNYNVVPAVANVRKQSGKYGTRFGTNNPIQSYKDYIENTVLRKLGYEVIKWMGITPDGKNYTGVEVETPVLPGIGKDNVGNTELDKLEIGRAHV